MAASQTDIKRVVPKLYLIGDSNTQRGSSTFGFVSKLQERYVRKCDVMNRGFSGYTSQHVEIIIHNLMQADNHQCHVKVATILLGSNDCSSKQLDARHVPLVEFEQNLNCIIATLIQHQVENIILISPPPIDVEKWNKHCLQTNGVEGGYDNPNPSQAYADVCRSVASGSPQVCLVDLYSEMVKHANWKAFFEDGLHFSDSGNDVLFKALIEKTDALFPDMVYPDWKTIDFKNPSSTLG